MVSKIGKSDIAILLEKLLSPVSQTPIRGISLEKYMHSLSKMNSVRFE